jgi:hypothetical protein
MDPQKLTESEIIDLMDQLVDRHGLSRVLGFLSEACEAKAQHIQQYRLGRKPDPLEAVWFENGALIQEVSEQVNDTD